MNLTSYRQFNVGCTFIRKTSLNLLTYNAKEIDFNKSTSAQFWNYHAHVHDFLNLMLCR